MTWMDFMKSLVGERQLIMLSTATNGLKPERGDKLLGFSIAKVDGTQQNYFRKVCRGDLLQGQEFHKIPESMQEFAVEEEELFEVLRSVFAPTNVVFTYNVPFQDKFVWELATAAGQNELNSQMYDLPLFVRMAETRLTFNQKDVSTLDKAMKLFSGFVGRPPAIKKLLNDYALLHEEDSSLPMQQYAEGLHKLYLKMAEMPCIIQGELEIADQRQTA